MSDIHTYTVQVFMWVSISSPPTGTTYCAHAYLGEGVRGGESPPLSDRLSVVDVGKSLRSTERSIHDTVREFRKYCAHAHLGEGVRGGESPPLSDRLSVVDVGKSPRSTERKDLYQYTLSTSHDRARHLRPLYSYLT
jgi:hypothetical protein